MFIGALPPGRQGLFTPHQAVVVPDDIVEGELTIRQVLEFDLNDKGEAVIRGFSFRQRTSAYSSDAAGRAPGADGTNTARWRRSGGRVYGRECE